LCGVKAWPAIAAAAVALVAADEGRASTPSPWCGTTPTASDRLPDATPGYAVHVAYVRSALVPDRFAAWAPRIVGDVAAIEAWWRAQDPARAPRFDLFPYTCATVFGRLDLTSIVLQQQLGDVDEIFDGLRFLLAQNNGFLEPEKTYLVYYDGPTGQGATPDVACGIGATRSGPLPGFAVVFLDSCSAEAGDTVRPVVAAHELVHALDAVAGEAPHACEDGHVCDAENDVMRPFVSGAELETLALDHGRDDYYGHAGLWRDVRDSLFLERADSPDRAPPSTPATVTATDGTAGTVRLSWGRATDDVGPVTYRVYQDGHFVRSTTGTSALLGVGESPTSAYAVRAVDTVGHLSPSAVIRFRVGVGIVDERGRLVRDTVKPAAIPRVTIRRTAATTRLTWPAVRDAGSPVRYRAKIGTRTILLTKPSLTLERARVRTGVTLVVVDRAGNVSPVTAVPLRLLR
jgi:hypothetical protein